jgi:adenylate cyclase class 2
MQYEVEQKFRVNDLGAIDEKLRQLGAADGPAIVQIDCYFRHPSRDFEQTDEALRIRTVGNKHWITYKGPKIDPETKTRRELELPIGAGQQTIDGFTELLEAVGFSQVRKVRKTRRSFQLTWQGAEIDGAIDTVDGLGQFVELEIVVDQAGVETAREQIQSLAGELGLTVSERRSYLEMLLQVERRP